MKTDLSPTDTWHGLPLSPAQNREVLNYIERCGRAGTDWNTPELRAMIADMLHPPELGELGGDEIAGCTASESFTASHEDPDRFQDDVR